MQHCTRCHLEAGIDKVTFDSNGVCSYCHTIDKYAPILEKIGKQEALLTDRLDRFRNVGKYDCLVGFSGGKDSSYVIYRLRSHYNARVMAFTWDNGFLTDYARENINLMVKEFDLDHEWVRPKDAVLRSVYRESITADCWPCSGCYHFAEASPWKLAYEHRIPYIVHGRIPEQILRGPDDASFESEDSLIADNFQPYDLERVKRLAERTIKRFQGSREWLIPDRSLWPLSEEDMYLRSDFELPDDFAPEVLGFFLYETHNESRIMDILEKETSWERPDQKTPLSHADCEAHDAAGWLYTQNYGRLFLNLEISALVRHNKLDREEGAKILNAAREEVGEYPSESMKALSAVCGISSFNLRLMPKRIKTTGLVKGAIKKLIGRS